MTRAAYVGRMSTLVPIGKAALGEEVWWQRTWYVSGYPHRRWWHGTVEVKRGRLYLVRDKHGHEHEVGSGSMYKRISTRQPDT